MFKNVASQKFIVFAFDSTTNLPKTGDAANITAYVSKDFGAVTVLGDTSATEMDATNAKGYYLFDAAQAETNADVLAVTAKSATANIVVIGAPATIFTFPASFTAFTAPLSAAQVQTAADAAITANATIIEIEAETDDIAAIKTKTDKLTFTVAGQVDANIQYVNDVLVNGVGSSGNPWGP